MFKHSKINIFMILAISFAFIVILVISSIGYYATNRLQKNIRDIYVDRFVPAVLAENINKDMVLIRLYVAKTIYSGEDYNEHIDPIVKDINKKVKQYKMTKMDGLEIKNITLFEKNFKIYINIWKDIYTRNKINKQQISLTDLDDFALIGDELINNMDALVKYDTSIGKYLKNNSDNLYVKTKYSFILLILIALIALSLFTFYALVEHRKLRFCATMDIATGVFNRGKGIDYLDKLILTSKKNRKIFSIIFTDINGLKKVNDTLGHAEGDELILMTTKLMAKSIGDKGIICRLGGDEFLIILPNFDVKNAQEIWAYTQEQFDNFNKVMNKPYMISVSYGFAQFDQDTQITSEELIAIADRKMYEDKRNYKVLAKK